MPPTTRVRRLALVAVCTLTLGTLGALPSVASASAPAERPAPVYPAVGAGTHFVDDAQKLAGFNDPEWYRANIPFLDIPDSQIESVYYYRWRTYKEHLRYTNPTDGWISTEFLDCCGYAAPYQAISAAAGHQITEGRWVRDTTYDDDDVAFWLTGPGQSAKPATDDVNADTTDWAHEYSFWAATAAYQQAQVTGDTSRLVALLPALEKQWHGWDKQYNASLGLYWSVPVWDAMEYSASSYASTDPYHGGAGYRPTLNSYQYGDAVAISKVAALAGDRGAARSYAAKAASLKVAMQAHLWDPERDFYYHVARDDNPDLTKLDTREEIGFLPWTFEAADASDSSAWGQLLDPQGFASAYGPTTAERRSPVFMKDAGSCCRWDGPSWPYSTSQTLTGMANLLDDYPSQPTITAADYYAQLRTYALTQYKNGRPYVAEAHDPDADSWSYDGADHSEDYNHSTYDDNVISGLMGLRPSTGDTLSVKPLVPASWDHFALENVPYHGHNVTLMYDRDGTHYHAGTGMRVYVDGQEVTRRAGVQAVTVNVGATHVAVPATLVNDAANPLRTGYPKPITSYTWQNDNPWNALDGKVWFTEVPEDTRWTNYSSPNAQDYYGVDFGAPTSVSDVRFYGYDDGGGVRPAAAYTLQYWTGAGWADVPQQTHSPQAPVGNGLNRITFPALRTSQIRLLFTNPSGAFVGVTELQSWRDQGPGVTVGIAGASATSPVQVRPGTATTVRTTVVATAAERQVSAFLQVPAGWSVVATSPTRARYLTAGQTLTTSWLVTPPSGSAPGDPAVLRAEATYRSGGQLQQTQQAVPSEITFDLAYWSHPLVDDTFGADTSADFTPVQPDPAEVVPTVTAGGGRLTGTAASKYFALLDRGAACSGDDCIVIVDPAEFTGSAGEDSLFVGLVKDADNYASGWYNNHGKITGADVRVGGAYLDAGKSGFGAATFAVGDRFAAQLHGQTLTTWQEHAGTWTALGRVDLIGTISATDLAGYHVEVGLRADSGTLSISRFQALEH